MPATDTAGSKSPASAILIGVLVLAGLLVAAAVVVTVLNSNKTPAPEEMAAAAREHAQATCGAQDFGRHVLEVYRQSLRRRPARIISRPVVTA